MTYPLTKDGSGERKNGTILGPFGKNAVRIQPEGTKGAIVVSRKLVQPVEEAAAGVTGRGGGSKLDTPRKLKNAVKLTDAKLGERTTAKAQKEASKDFMRPNQGNMMLTQLRGTDPKHLSVGDRESLMEYLGLDTNDEYGTEQADDTRRAHEGAGRAGEARGGGEAGSLHARKPQDCRR